MVETRRLLVKSVHIIELTDDELSNVAAWLQKETTHAQLMV
jgi:hypothetical protein